MTDYKLACPDCGLDASLHVRIVEGSATRDGVTVTMGFADTDHDACPRTAASLYAAECARISGHLAKLQEAHAIVWAERDAAIESVDRWKAQVDQKWVDYDRCIAERDAARAECERMRDERRMANRPVLVTEWDLLVAERDRYKAALELILKIDSYTAGAKDIASTALDAGTSPVPAPQPPSAEAVAWFKSIPDWNMESLLTDEEKRCHAEILRFVEGR